jgi:hypothetical protein
MTALEAIPKVALLIADLIKRGGDRQTQALVTQIQMYQGIIQQGLIDANAKIAKMEDEHPKAIAALKEAHRQEIAALKPARQRIIPDDGFGSCRVEDM